MAAMLSAYAVFFSFAYRDLTAATGALLLFGAVQLTMMGYGLWAGRAPRAALRLLGPGDGGGGPGRPAAAGARGTAAARRRC